MSGFACKSRDGSGALIEQVVEAASRREAMNLLLGRGLHPISVVRRDGAADGTGPAREGAKPARKGRARKIKLREIHGFTVRLSAALRAGVPILSSLALMRDQCSNPTLQEVLTAVHADVEGGESLSVALGKHPQAFPEVYVNSVAAGEQSGTLGELLENIADFLEIDIEVRGNVRSAMMYPCIVVGTLGLAILVLLIFVVPRFNVLYSGNGGSLPLPTQLMIGASSLVTDHLHIVLALAALGVFAARKALRTREGRRRFDKALLGIPLIGKLIRTALTLRAVQMLGLFCEAGLPILEALGTITRTTHNSHVQGELRGVTDAVAGGESLSVSMRSVTTFDPAVLQMLECGEATGTLQDTCRTVGKQLQKDLAYLSKNVATFIEPVLTLFLAVIVLFVALATFLPMWDMVKVIG